MNYQFVKCLNPRHITNIYTNESILVECGKCESCLMKKSLASTTRCKLESSVHRFTFFVTLTYDNQHLPLMRLICSGDFGRYDFVGSDGEVFGSYNFMSLCDKNSLIRKCNTPFNTLPYIRVKDCQDFIKRLRKYIYKRTNEKIRLFYCGEYGPVHFRPHFHLLLWFDKDETLEIITQGVSSCWSFGRVDAQLSSGKSASYVASYVNSNMHLPGVFKFRQTSPISHHSFYLGESVFQDIGKALQDDDYARVVRQRVFRDGINSDIVLWRSLKTRILPKCKGFNQKSEQERIFSYQLNEKLREWTQEVNPLYQARFITDYVILFDFYSDDERFCEMLQYFRRNYGYYIFDSAGFSRYSMPSITDWSKFQRSVYMELLLSRRFIRDYCDGDASRIPTVLKKIDNCYKYIDYENLRQQLELEKQFSKTPDNEMNKFFFHNKFIVDELKETKMFNNFKTSRKDMFRSFIKHKELNDKNKIFNYI